MTARTPSERELLRGAAQRLAEQVPPALPVQDAQRLVRRAMLAASGREARSQRGLLWCSLVGAGALAGALLVSLADTQHRHAPNAHAAVQRTVERATRFTLPTGDRLQAQPESEFEVSSTQPAHRRVRLRRGHMLFDVVKLGTAQHFEVVTDDVQVSVLGTVFTVETRAGQTVVRVYEGHVSVMQAGRQHIVDAGGLFVSNDARPATDDALRSAATAAVAQRTAAHASAAAAREPEAQSPTGDTPSTPPVASLLDAGTAARSRSAAATSTITSVDAPVGSVWDAQQALMAGHAQLALSAAQHAVDERRQPQSEWAFLQAAALVELGEPRAAAEALEAAATYLRRRPAHEAAYRAALLYFEQLADPARALHVLQASNVSGPDRFVEARGTELRVRLLLALQRRWEASTVARRYLRNFPDGDARAYMWSVAKYQPTESERARGEAEVP